MSSLKGLVRGKNWQISEKNKNFTIKNEKFLNNKKLIDSQRYNRVETFDPTTQPDTVERSKNQMPCIL